VYISLCIEATVLELPLEIEEHFVALLVNIIFYRIIISPKMTHFTQSYDTMASYSFSITQVALGSPLQFEPALGSKELDNLIDNYVSGFGTPQQKRAQVVLQFLNSIEASGCQHPVSLCYYVPQCMAFGATFSQTPAMSFASPPAMQQIPTHFPANTQTSKSASSLKRQRQESGIAGHSSSKRLPGFSIMTKEGIDITEYASRGPKTKEQRDHAALMRKLKACGPCKKSKQRVGPSTTAAESEPAVNHSQCDPSHHRLSPISDGTPNSASFSESSGRDNSFSSAMGSQGSVSPLSSLGESFTQSPSQSIAPRAIAHSGQNFPSFPADFTMPSTGFDAMYEVPNMSTLSTDMLDPSMFQIMAPDEDIWGQFPQFPSDANSYEAWNNNHDFYALSSGASEIPEPQNLKATPDGASRGILHDTMPQRQETMVAQNRDRPTTTPTTQSPERLAYRDSEESSFDITQWLDPSVCQDDNHSLQERRCRPSDEQEQADRAARILWLASWISSVKVSQFVDVPSIWKALSLTLMS
jgi:hypothetical protein